MLTDFIEKKLKEAEYKELQDGTFFGEISGLDGVWVNASTLDGAKKELQEVLEDWIVFKIQDNNDIPGLRIVDKRETVHA